MKLNKITILKIAATGVVITLISSIIDTQELLVAFKSISPTYYIIALALNIVGSVVLNSAQIHEELRHSSNTTRQFFRKILAIDFQVRFYALFLPLALTSAIRWRKYKAIGVDSITSAGSMLINKFQQLSIIFLVSFISLALYDEEVLTDTTATILSISCAILFALSLSICIILLKKHDSTAVRLLIRWTVISLPLSKKRKIKLFKNITTKIRTSSKSASPVESYELKLIKLLIWSLASFSTAAISQYLVISSLSVHIDLSDAFFVRAITFLTMMIPFSIAGIGFREIGTIGALSIYGVPPEIGLVSGIILFSFQVIISLIGGLLELRFHFTPPSTESAK
jgi:uncharacterized membrane protein YbhN (UPF0104 family)